MPQSDGDELVVFLGEEDAAAPVEAARDTWRILVVDDDPDVFEATRFALSDARVLDRELELFSVYSAAEAEAFLRNDPNIAVILLDVVMESEDAGLKLADLVRNELQLSEPRIILRTGQPGYAPELEVITRYDINDYRTKSELTRARLLTTLIAALRSYQQIRNIEANRVGLRQVIDATSDLLTRNGIQNFAEGVMTQIEAIFTGHTEGLIVIMSMEAEDNPVIQTGTGRFAELRGMPLQRLPDASIREGFSQVLKNRASQFNNGGSYFYFAGSQSPIAAYVAAPREALAPGMEVLNLFCQNIALCSDNLSLIERLERQAFYDELSGLPNRLRFLEVADGCLSQAEPKALGLLDIDHFNHVVENTGSEIGDMLIAQIGRRLLQHFQPLGVTVGRLGSDVFALIGPSETIAHNVHALFANPFEAHELKVPLSATLGVAPLGDDCPTVQSAISGAYVALKQAKLRQRGTTAWYTANQHQQQNDRIEILNGLHQALKDQEFFLVFQPQLRLKDRQPVGCESLIRWRRQDGGLVPPGKFIPVAESAGLIGAIGDWVLVKSIHSLSLLHRQGHSGLGMAINVSMAQLRDPAFIDRVHQTLERYAVPPETVKLEMTETMAMEEINLVLEAIDGLKSLGVRISLDDFGTGFSSLAYLQQLRLDQLKIDRAFVDGIGEQLASRQIADTIIHLAQALELEVLAEGIETVEQEQQLLEMGCELAQGYLFAKPMTFEQLVDWLEPTD